MRTDSERNNLRGALVPGTSLGIYRIESVLGHGGFGIVYRAHHMHLGTIVAIKEFLPIEIAVRDGDAVHPRSLDCMSAFEEAKDRFLEEAKQLVQFRKHQGVVTCLEFFRANGTAYFVMELEVGMPLSELLQRRENDGRPLDEGDLLAIAEPLLETLSEVHEAGVLHRDIKPSNILVRREDGMPILMDFGAAKRTVALRTKSLAPNTEGYAAIEQIGEGHLGTWTDLYGVGAVLWRIVAGGKPPWRPPNPMKVESRLNATLRGARDPMPSAREIGSGRFSEGVLDAIDSCLVLRETERIQTCEQLLGQLRSDSLDRDAQDELSQNNHPMIPQVAQSPDPGNSGDHTHEHSSSNSNTSSKAIRTVSRYLLKSIAGLTGAMFCLAGRGIRESGDAEGASLWLIFHIIGMVILYLIFFRWSYTMNAPLRGTTRHKIPLAICWYFLGTVSLIGAFSLLAIGYQQEVPIQNVISSYLGDFLGFDMVILATVSIISATGILYGARWAMNTVIILSFVSSASIGGFLVAWYTWWVSSSSVGKILRQEFN